MQAKQNVKYSTSQKNGSTGNSRREGDRVRFVFFNYDSFVSFRAIGVIWGIFYC